MFNSTITENTSSGYGPALALFGSSSFVLISHSTIYRNHFNECCPQTGGVAVDTGVPLFMRNSIVAGHALGDITGTLTTSDHNLIGSTEGGSGFSSTDILNVDPKLGHLTDNGGLTLTRALLPGSPAIDAGDNADAPEFDQRGPGFPRIVNGTIDIGAFEVQASGAPSSPGHFAVSVSPISEALKGCDMQAQGNALGNEAIIASALKVRNQDAVESGVRMAPLQGLVHRKTQAPRALPWADLFRPVGAENDYEFRS